MFSTQLLEGLIDPESVAEAFVYLLRNGVVHNGDPFYITCGALSGLRPTTQAFAAALTNNRDT